MVLRLLERTSPCTVQFFVQAWLGDALEGIIPRAKTKTCHRQRIQRPEEKKDEHIKPVSHYSNTPIPRPTLNRASVHLYRFVGGFASLSLTFPTTVAAFPPCTSAPVAPPAAAALLTSGSAPGGGDAGLDPPPPTSIAPGVIHPRIRPTSPTPRGSKFLAS